MIVKLLTRNNPTYASLLKYILKKGKNEQPQVITHNLRSKDIEGWTKEFLINESYRKNVRKDQVFLFHTVLAISTKDKVKVKPEIMEDIARKYIDLHGKEGIYLGAVHTDKEHTHIHFCTSGTKLYTGEGMRLSHGKLRELKIELQKYHIEKYPELENSICEHGSGKPYKNNRAWRAEQRNQVKESIRKKVKACFDKARTKQQFLEYLREEDLNHYERSKGEPTGVVYENMKFRFSRLGIEFKSLPTDLREELQALREIESIRQLRREQSLEPDQER